MPEAVTVPGSAPLLLRHGALLPPSHKDTESADWSTDTVKNMHRRGAWVTSLALTFSLLMGGTASALNVPQPDPKDVAAAVTAATEAPDAALEDKQKITSTAEELKLEQQRATELKTQAERQAAEVLAKQAQVAELAQKAEVAMQEAETARQAAGAAEAREKRERENLAAAKKAEQDARNILDAYAAENYRSMSSESLSSVNILLDNRGPADAIHGSKVLEHIGVSQADATVALANAKKAQIAATAAAESANLKAQAQAKIQEAKLLEAETLRNEQTAVLEQLRVLLDTTRTQVAAADTNISDLTTKLAAAEEAHKVALARIAEQATAAEFQKAAELAAANPLLLAGPLCTDTNPGQYSNGQIPDSALCPLTTAPGHKALPAAAAAFDAMSRQYFAETGNYICVTDSYRDLAGQIDIKARKPGLAAKPGTSNHGWGRALDLCGGINTFGSPAHNWMRANAPKFGWFHPAWAGQNGSKPEAWHWEFAGTGVDFAPVVDPATGKALALGACDCGRH